MSDSGGTISGVDLWETISRADMASAIGNSTRAASENPGRADKVGDSKGEFTADDSMEILEVSDTSLDDATSAIGERKRLNGVGELNREGIGEPSMEMERVGESNMEMERVGEPNVQGSIHADKTADTLGDSDAGEDDGTSRIGDRMDGKTKRPRRMSGVGDSKPKGGCTADDPGEPLGDSGVCGDDMSIWDGMAIGDDMTIGDAMACGDDISCTVGERR